MKKSESKLHKAKAASDDLGQQIDALRADVTKLMSNASDDVAEGLDMAGHQISKTSRNARKLATNSVADHPMTAVGIAIGVGVLVGLVARRTETS